MKLSKAAGEKNNAFSFWVLQYYGRQGLKVTGQKDFLRYICTDINFFSVTGVLLLLNRKRLRSNPHNLIRVMPAQGAYKFGVWSLRLGVGWCKQP
jgi:hypothetical protein